MTSRPVPPGRPPAPGRLRNRTLAGALSLALLGALVPAAATAAEPSDDGLVAWYPLDGDTADASGHGLDGTVDGTADWDGLGLGFDGGTAVDLPDDMVADLTDVTVAADVWIDPALSGNYFLYTFGNTAVGSPQSGDGYLFSTGDSAYRATISDAAWGAEQNTRAGSALPRGSWVHVAFTLSDGTGTLYQDGDVVATNDAITLTPADLGAGSTTRNALGRSAYDADGLFEGRMKDFRLYDRALTGTEVTDLVIADAAPVLAADVEALDLGDVSAVQDDLDLPDTAPGGSAVTWASSDPSVLGADGTYGAPDTTTDVTLTATLDSRGATATKDITATVLPPADDAQRAQAAADALEVTNLDDVRGNLTLPTSGAGGAEVTWATASDTITPTGEVTRPAHGEDAQDVELTATVTVGEASAQRTFAAHVPALPVVEDYEGYLFSYFIGEGYADGEQVYFGLSQGNDPLKYQNLNDNEPVLTSELGEEGLRDPFIIRSPEGDKFYQIATDLRIYDGNGWDAAQRQGSRSIMVWESTDLVHWTDQRLVEVSPETAGNTWAPEAYYDESIGAYVVFWASKLYAEDDPGHTGDSYNRMMYATTRDFVTFTEPQVWIDPGYSVIDSTVTLHDGEYYRFTKDERNNTSSTPCSKFITAEKSTELRGGDYEFVTDCIGKANSLSDGIDRGEGPTIFKSNTEERWYLFIDEFGGRGYVPFETTDLDAAEWVRSSDYEMPSRPRHGTVLPVTQDEYDRLLRQYQPDAVVESVDDVELTVQVGDAPVLPAQVSVTYADGSAGSLAVTWDDVDPADYAAAGTFEVAGTLAQGVSLPARAVVTVTDEPVAVEDLRVSPEALELAVGGERTMTATVIPANASARQVSWTSADTSVATVDADGVVTGVAAGSAVVTATTADSTFSVDVPVTVTTDIPGLVVRYPLDETTGTTAANTAPGSAFGAASLENGASFTGEGVALDGTDDFVDLPDDLLSGVEDVTVALDVRIDDSQSSPYFVYGLGNSSGSAGDGYLFTTGNAYRTSIATGNWTTEQTVTKGSNLDRGVWKHLAYTLEGDTAVLYEDGVEVARQTGVTIDPGDIGDGSTAANYLGRSLYSGDNTLSGDVADFRIYDRALSAEEVASIGVDHTGVSGVGLDELKVDAIVDAASSTVTLPVVPGTDLSALAPTLQVADGTEVAPSNGSVQDFTDPVEYTLTGPDGSQRTWTLRAVEMRSPVLPGYYADPNIAQFGDTFYLYATSDGYSGWGGQEFFVWTSQNLVDWERSDEPFLTLDGADGDVPWATGNAWAPTITERDGKYYFYFSGQNPDYGHKTIGVAVADDPAGPFTAEPEAMITNTEDVTSGQAIDPATFRDPETGKYYLFWGNGSPVYAELSDDMRSVKADTITRIEGLQNFREGLFVNYRDGQYHLTYSIDDTGSENYRVGYATSESVDGPWTYQGVILSKDTSQGLLGTGHSSILNVSGTDDWYIAYHRFAIPGGDGTHRETTIDRLTFGEDGLIEPVVPTLTSVDPVDLTEPLVEVTPVRPTWTDECGPANVTGAPLPEVEGVEYVESRKKDGGVKVVATPLEGYVLSDKPSVTKNPESWTWTKGDSGEECPPEYPVWDASTVYTAGDRVSFEGAVFEATWWTRGDEPGASPYSSWQEIAETSDGVAVWTPSRIFTAGDVVVHDGVTYTAQWWTRNQEPGTSSWGPW
ncbi:family 43 glycosylhydrolase, partial [Isoptericola aurantiacus]|uniref:family 43 glycosylhydrolase n=1 Tax=Isoptericola aurantiacus TaxID=3377839 RepID=UPI00383BD186